MSDNRELDIFRWQNRQRSEVDIICPWCGFAHGIPLTWEFDLGQYEIKCQQCGRPMKLDVYPVFVTRKPESMYDKDVKGEE